MFKTASVVLLVGLLAHCWAQDEPVFHGEGCDTDELYQREFKPTIVRLESDVKRIIDYVTRTKAGNTYDELAYFVDKFGYRLTGTKNLENAIDYMQRLLRKEGHDNVHGERVKIPVWTRGKEYASMVKPRVKNLNILGLGYSVGTNGTEIEAPVLVVKNFTDLEAKADQVKGKIVVYNYHYESYGIDAVYRVSGASRAAKYGAIAAMIRSLTPFSINSPHTGMMTYTDGIPKIPAISITVEDAQMFQRISDRNEEIVVRFSSENQLHEPGYSRNTVSEIFGSQYPDEVVLVSGHLDSWDVGQGAMDDGGGAFIAWRSLSVVRQLGLKPKRTIRSVLWTGEEFGLIGAQSFVQEHKSQLGKMSVAMESDIGTFTPRGLTYSGKNKTAQCAMWQVLNLMKPINASRLILAAEGSDTMMFVNDKVPIVSLDNANENYFDFHHSEGDMMTVENSADLDRCLALWTSVSYVLASLDHLLPR